MIRSCFAATLVIAFCLGTVSLVADVRTQEKSLVRFEGGLGKVINFFAGKAAKEGVVQTVALLGDRKATLNDTTGTIVDLKEEKVYDLDIKKKKYTVTTFAEMRRRIEEARKKADEQARKAEAEGAKESEKPADPGREMEVDFDVKETGQRKSINGFETKQVIMTIGLREKGKTLEQSGGLVLTSDMWMGPAVPAMRELTDFDIRYARALQGPETFGASVEQMQAALATHPQLKQGLARMAEESKKLEGTAILTTTTMEVVKSAEQLAQEQQAAPGAGEDKSAPPTSVGGLLGGLGRRMARNKDKEKDAGGPQPRVAFMTITTERLSITPNASAADVAIPAGFKEDR
ncbi:MAG: hypothetical protein AB7N65_15895 [Vicinamibacterales bacterium]